jgi:hypothetical protein
MSSPCPCRVKMWVRTRFQWVGAWHGRLAVSMTAGFIAHAAQRPLDDGGGLARRVLPERGSFQEPGDGLFAGRLYGTDQGGGKKLR